MDPGLRELDRLQGIPETIKKDNKAHAIKALYKNDVTVYHAVEGPWDMNWGGQTKNSGMTMHEDSSIQIGNSWNWGEGRYAQKSGKSYDFRCGQPKISYTAAT